MAKQQISMPLNEAQAAFVQQRAQFEDRSKAAIIRRIVEQARVAEQLQRPTAAWEAA
jgi:hypothetical protein